MLLSVSFSAINVLRIAKVIQLKVLKGDYSNCKMPLCLMKSSAGANASINFSNICSERSTRRLKPCISGLK